MTLGLQKVEIKSPTIKTSLSKICGISIEEINNGLTEKQIEYVTFMIINHPEDVWELSKFPNLKTLEIVSSSKNQLRLSELNHIELPFLPKLRELTMENMPGVERLDIRAAENLFSVKINNNPDLKEVIGIDKLLNPVEIELYGNNINKMFDINHMLSNNVVPNFNLDLSFLALFEKENAFFNNEIQTKQLASSAIHWAEMCKLTSKHTLEFIEGIELNTKVNELLQQLLTVSMSDIEKICAITCWIEENIEFDIHLPIMHTAVGKGNMYLSQSKQANNNNSSSYYVLKEHKASCEGYCNLLRFMLQRCGIKAETVLCYIKNDSANVLQTEEGYVMTNKCNHTVVRVETSAGWFYIDPTMDSIDPHIKKYFFKTKEEILKYVYLNEAELEVESPRNRVGMFSDEKLLEIFNSRFPAEPEKPVKTKKKLFDNSNKSKTKEKTQKIEKPKKEKKSFFASLFSAKSPLGSGADSALPASSPLEAFDKTSTTTEVSGASHDGSVLDASNVNSAIQAQASDKQKATKEEMPVIDPVLNKKINEDIKKKKGVKWGEEPTAEPAGPSLDRAINQVNSATTVAGIYEDSAALIDSGASHDSSVDDVGVDEAKKDKIVTPLQLRKAQEEEELKELNIDQFKDMGFDYHQLELINEGIEARVNVRLFAMKEYASDQMREILTGLERGLDVCCMLDPNLNGEQMQILRYAIEKKMNIDNIKQGKNAEEMAYYYAMQAKNKKYNDEVFKIDDFNRQQLNEIKIGVLMNVSVQSYLSPKFDPSQMRIIRRGVECGLDVSQYAKPEINADDMNEIFFKLKKL